MNFISREFQPQNILCILLLSFPTIFPMIPVLSNQPYTTQQAVVRQGTGLCNEEIQYMQTRLPKVKNALETILGQQLQDNEVPNIALCNGGGEFHAMLATLGSLQGAEINIKRAQPTKSFLSSIMNYFYYLTQLFGFNSATSPDQPNSATLGIHPLNIMDCCVVIASASGSTWATTGLMQSYMPVTQYLENLSQQIQGQSLVDNVNIENIVAALLQKEQYSQPISFIDIYGELLAQKILAGLGNANPHSFNLTSYKSLVDLGNGNIPLPINTALIGADTVDYQWIEYTPYEVGSIYLNAFVPTWAFGRLFNNGLSQDFAPAQSLGFGLGIWGSVMSVDPKEFFDLIIEPDLGTLSVAFLEQHFGKKVALGAHILTTLYNSFILETSKTVTTTDDSILDKRLSPAKVFNWAYGMENAQLNNVDTLELIDAGICMSLPFPPLLRQERPIDIIIVLDASLGQIGQELYKAKQWAQEHGIPFPPIDYNTVNQVCSVHYDPTDPTVPTIIYLPLIQNPGYSSWDPQSADFVSTFNFTYSYDQIQLLTGLTKYNMQQSQPVIIDAINQWITRKRNNN